MGLRCRRIRFAVDRRQAGEGWWGFDRAAATLPDLPTSAEAGLPEFERRLNGLFARRDAAGDHCKAQYRGSHGVESDASKNALRSVDRRT